MKKRLYIYIILIIFVIFFIFYKFKTQEAVTTSNYVNVVNIANQCAIIADGTGNTHNLNDGDSKTWWCSNNKDWPAAITVAFPTRGKKVERFVLKFLEEDAYPERSVDIDVEFYIDKKNNESIKKDDFKFYKNDFVYDFSIPLQIVKIKIILSDPKDSGRLAGFWPAMQEIEVYSKDIEENAMNMAPKFKIITANNKPDANNKLVDNKPQTIWDAGSNTWPSVLTFDTPDDLTKVYKVVIKFEKQKPNWSMNVDLLYSMKDSQDNYILARSQKDQNFNKDFVYRFSEPINLARLRIELSNPKNKDGPVTFWPGLAEVQIWGSNNPIKIQVSIED